MALAFFHLVSPFKHGLKLYTIVYIVSSLASLGNATNRLSNAVIYSYIEPHCLSSCNLSLEPFLSFNGAYWFMNSFSNSGKLFGVLPYTSSLSIYLAELPPISATAYWHAASVSAALGPMYMILTTVK